MHSNQHKANSRLVPALLVDCAFLCACMKQRATDLGSYLSFPHPTVGKAIEDMPSCSAISKAVSIAF